MLSGVCISVGLSCLLRQHHETLFLGPGRGKPVGTAKTSAFSPKWFRTFTEVRLAPRVQLTGTLHCLPGTSRKKMKTNEAGSRLSPCPSETLAGNEATCSHSKQWFQVEQIGVPTLFRHYYQSNKAANNKGLLLYFLHLNKRDWQNLANHF